MNVDRNSRTRNKHKNAKKLSKNMVLHPYTLHTHVSKFCQLEDWIIQGGTKNLAHFCTPYNFVKY